MLSSQSLETAPKPRRTGVEPGARSPVPGSDSLALRGVRCWSPNCSARRRFRNHHSLHVPPAPPPLRLHDPGALGRHYTLRVGEETGTSPTTTVLPENRGRESTHPQPQSQLHPLQTYCKVGSQVAAVRSGAQPWMLSTAGGGSPLCREPHWARTSAWRRRQSSPAAASSWARAPSSPRYVSLRPRPRLPAPALVSTAPRLPRRGEHSSRPPRPRSEAPGGYPDRRPRSSRASAHEELEVLRGTVWGLLQLLRGILLDVPC